MSARLKENKMKDFMKSFDSLFVVLLIVFQFIAMFNVIAVPNNTLFVFLCYALVRIIMMDNKIKENK